MSGFPCDSFPFSFPFRARIIEVIVYLMSVMNCQRGQALSDMDREDPHRCSGVSE